MFNAGRFTNTIKPFSISFQPLLNQIENKEKALKQLATMATMEGVKGEHTVGSIKLQGEVLTICLSRHSSEDQCSRRNERAFRSDFG
jgi:hypothetical protein